MDNSSIPDIIGLEGGVVRLVPYTAEWKRLFEEEKARLQAAIGPYVLDIQHVGSTAIPGIPAKPIIDIAVAVSDFEEARVCIQPLESLGYEYRGEFGIPRRHYFSRGEPRTHHLHMNEAGSRDLGNQVLFRDYLLQHPSAAQEYAELKIELAQQFADDRDAYLAGKAPFIERILARAREDAQHECLVCRKHRGQVPVFGGAIYQDDLIFISHAQPWGDAQDAYLGHLFVEPRRHAPGLSDLTADEAQAIGLHTTRLAQALMRTEKVEHVYSFVIGDGVPHLHVHVIGRYPGAPREYWGCEVDEWPGAPRGGETEIAQLAARLRAFLTTGAA